MTDGSRASDTSEMEEDDDEPLLELEADDSDADTSSNSEEHSSEALVSSESEIDIDLEAKKSGELGTLAQQAKSLRSELQRTADSDEESEEEEEEEEDDRLGWGSTNLFYGTNEDGKQDAEEENDIEATLELQRAELEELHDSDFEIPTAVASKEAAFDARKKETDDTVDDQEALTELYSDLKRSLTEVQSKIGPVLQEARKGDLCTEEGLAYLEVKHLLLLHYCMCIVFYVLSKLEGASVKDHPVVLRLIEIRAYLEKLKPLEARLQPQMEKLLRAVSLAEDVEAEDDDDEDRMAPHPEDLIPKVQEGTEEVYRPPKQNPVKMDDGSPKRKRRGKGKKTGTVHDDTVSEIVRDMTGAPEELSTGASPLDRMKSILAERRASKLTAHEEELYSRSTPGRETKKQARRNSELFGGVSLSDFNEDIANTVRAIEAAESLPQVPIRKQKESVPSGDADAPRRDPKPQTVPLLKRTLDSDDDDEKKRPKKKSKKTSVVKHSLPPMPAKTTKGPRAISATIEKNRGLTPHRARERKNPRRRHRLQFEKKEKRRKGQATMAYSQAPDHYGGEASGITKRVKKGVKFA